MGAYQKMQMHFLLSYQLLNLNPWILSLFLEAMG